MCFSARKKRAPGSPDSVRSEHGAGEASSAPVSGRGKKGHSNQSPAVQDSGTPVDGSSTNLGRGRRARKEKEASMDIDGTHHYLPSLLVIYGLQLTFIPGSMDIQHLVMGNRSIRTNTRTAGVFQSVSIPFYHFLVLHLHRLTNTVHFQARLITSRLAANPRHLLLLIIIPRPITNPIEGTIPTVHHPPYLPRITFQITSNTLHLSYPTQHRKVS